MSQFNQSVPIPRQGIQEGLDAPGLTPQPAAVPGGENSRQLLEALQAGQGVVGAAAQQAARNRQVEQQFENDIEQLDQGLASRHARMDLPELQQQVRAGDLMPEAGDDGEEPDPGNFALEHVESRTEGMPEAYRQRYAEMITPRLTDAIIQKQQEVQRDADEQNLGNLRDNAISADPSPERFSSILESARTLTQGRYNDRELKRAVLLPALETAAQQAPQSQAAMARYNAIRETLGGDHQQAQAEAAQTLEQSRRRSQAVANDRLEREFSAELRKDEPSLERLGQIVVDSDATEPAKLQFSRQIQSIRERESDRQHDRYVDGRLDQIRLGVGDPGGFLSELAGDTLRDPSDPRHLSDSEYTKMERRLEDQFVSQRQAEVNDRAYNAALNGQLGTIEGDVQVRTPTGKPRSVGIDRPAVMRRVDATIRRQAYADVAGVPMRDAGQMTGVERSFAENLTLIRQTSKRNHNGVFDNRAQGRLNSLGSTIDVDDFVQTGEEGGLPEDAEAWFHRFRTMDAAEQTFVENNVDEKPYRFWSNARMFYEMGRADTPRRAMLRAAQVEQSIIEGGEPFNAMTDAEFRESEPGVIEDTWLLDPSMDDIKNAGEVRERLFQLASAKKQATGLSGSEALKQSAKDLREKHIAVNGYLVFIGDERLPAQIQSHDSPATAMRQFTRFAARRYKERNPDSEITEDNAVLRPLARRRGIWVLANGDDPPGTLPPDAVFDGQTEGGLPTAAFSAPEVNELFELHQQAIMDGAVGDLAGREFDTVFEDRLERAGLTRTVTSEATAMSMPMGMRGLPGPIESEQPVPMDQLDTEQRERRRQMLQTLADRYIAAGLEEQIPNDVRREIGMELLPGARGVEEAEQNLQRQGVIPGRSRSGFQGLR